MWATNMIVRVTGSSLFANHSLAYLFAYDHRSVSTALNNANVITKMRDLRARNPYALFIKDNYSEISAKYPDLKLVDISKKAAEIWKTLPVEKKQSYIKKSQDQKINYEEEKKRLTPDDLQTVDADQKAKRIENRIKKSLKQLPMKRPRTAYAHFLSALDRGEADLRDFMKGASQRWSQMTVDDKQKFEDLHQEEKQKYVKELVAWASSNNPKPKPKSPRSSSSSSAKTKEVKVKKPRGKSVTVKRAAKKTTGSAKPASDKESSSSSDDDKPTKTKK